MYGPALANIHNTGFKSLSLAAADLIKENISPLNGPVVDLGCGAGDLLARFYPDIQEGYGVDISPEMVRLAAEKNPGYSFETNDIFLYSLPKARIFTMVGEILSYAGARQSDPESKAGHLFGNIAANLHPDGLFLFDFLSAHGKFQYTTFLDKEAYTLITQSRQQGATVTRQITSFVKEGNHYLKSTETHYLRTFYPKKIKKMLRKAGFVPQKCRTMGPHPLLPGRVAFLCRPG